MLASSAHVKVRVPAGVFQEIAGTQRVQSGCAAAIISAWMSNGNELKDIMGTARRHLKTEARRTWFSLSLNDESELVL